MGKGTAPNTPPLNPTSAPGGQQFNFANQVTPPLQVKPQQLVPTSMLTNGVPNPIKSNPADAIYGSGGTMGGSGRAHTQNNIADDSTPPDSFGRQWLNKGLGFNF